MIATGTALAIGALASGVGGAVKAKMQSNAAKKASEAQVKGTQDATNYMREGMGQLGQLWSPYVNAGAGAMGTLGRLTTPGPGARFASPGPPNAMPPQYGGGGMPSNMAMPRGGGGYVGQQYGPYGGTYPSPPPQMRMPDGRPIRGPYPMAAGGNYNVNEPTMFLAGEAGPEHASFSGTPGEGSDVGAFVPSRTGGMVPRNHPDAMPTDKVSGPMSDDPNAGTGPINFGNPIAGQPTPGGAVNFGNPTAAMPMPAAPQMPAMPQAPDMPQMPQPPQMPTMPDMENYGGYEVQEPVDPQQPDVQPPTPEVDPTAAPATPWGGMANGWTGKGRRQGRRPRMGGTFAQMAAPQSGQAYGRPAY